MKIKAATFFVTAFFIFCPAAYAQNFSKLQRDSLLQRLSIAKEDTNKITLYRTVLYSFTNYNANEGLKYVQPAIDLAQKLNWNVSMVQVMAGRLYWKLGKMDMALKYHFDALKLTDEKKDPNYFAYLCTFIGQDYADGGNYPEALNYFLKAKEIYLKTNNKNELGNLYLIISWVYNKQGNFPEESRVNLDGLRLYESLNDNYGIAIASSNLAQDYIMLGKSKEAIPYILKSNEICIKEHDNVNLSGNYISLADAYSNLYNYTEALKYTLLAYETGKKINDKMCMGDAKGKQGDIYFLQNNFIDAVTSFNSAIEYYRIINANHLLAEKYSKLSICYVRLHQSGLAKSALDSAAYFTQLLDSRSLLSGYLNGKQLYDSIKGNWKEAYFNYYKYVNLHDSIYNAENSKKMLQSQVQYEFDKKEAAAKAEQEKKDAIAQAEIKKQKVIRNLITGGLVAVILFSIVVYRQRNKISKARKLSDELLLNILPGEVAEELKTKGEAEAKQIDNATVLFTDFKGFTQLSEKLTPKELVAEIDSCFRAFDNIITKYGLEKIKTIGDSYMCAGGLPVPNTTHATDAVSAALDIQQFMQRHKSEREAAGKLFFEIRIGIHTGSVVAGIVGVKKYSYDIWGDTVNTASRMESSSEAGKVNISGSTYELIKDKFNCIHRGKIDAKNKGQIDMYFVES